ncbi:hypothetical protein MTR_8g038660 [Medicago truncatula]|uniref:Uncharacterized protein n=1 Tax=Medicago truncatula TaxID=3880 RepID=G7LFC6_MEDTR|nr:hypothetical protein MTR_8g038660 [Medicago truncatula]
MKPSIASAADLIPTEFERKCVFGRISNGLGVVRKSRVANHNSVPNSVPKIFQTEFAPLLLLDIGIGFGRISDGIKFNFLRFSDGIKFIPAVFRQIFQRFSDEIKEP